LARTSIVEVEPVQPRIFGFGSNRPAELIQALESATIASQDPFSADNPRLIFDSEVHSEYLEALGKLNAISRIKEAG
jgi:hypothetical protein